MMVALLRPGKCDECGEVGSVSLTRPADGFIWDKPRARCAGCLEASITHGSEQETLMLERAQ